MFTVHRQTSDDNVQNIIARLLTQGTVVLMATQVLCVSGAGQTLWDANCPVLGTTVSKPVIAEVVIIHNDSENSDYPL